MSLVRSFSDHQLVVLQDDEWLERQRIAGRSVVFCLDAAKSMINSRSGLTVSALRSELIMLLKTFKCSQLFNKGNIYNSSIKLYVNNLFNLAEDSYKFKDDDLVKIEIGSCYLNAVAKSTITIIKNSSQSSSYLEMFNVCQKALNNALLQIKPGKRLGCIGSGINHIIKNSLFKLASENAGSGLCDNEIFAEPIIASKSQSNSGIRIQEGMTFTVAPQVFFNSISGIGCCFEKTIFVRKDSIEIITPWSEVN
jgi:methionine aminopeptidase